MAKDSERLVIFGFSKGNTIEVDGKKYKVEGNTPEKRRDSIKEIKKSLPGQDGDIAKALEKIADHEWAEVANSQLAITSYPTSMSRYHIVLESWHQSVETAYYWCLNFLNDLGFASVDKVTDSFAAAEHSSLYGAAGQRLGLAQDKVGQYLATIGKMIKDLFQIVREMRWIDERLAIYREAFGHDNTATSADTPKIKEPVKGAEITLKGLWADLVDGVVGGQRTGSNIFNMQQQLNFSTLPDLFFAIHPRNMAEIDEVVDEQAKFANEQLRSVLKRKLNQYVSWKLSTYDEMINRRKFTLDYLRQHYRVIQLYISWIKPYLKHVQRLSPNQDFYNNPRLISSFESNITEVEILARLMPEGESDFACVLLTIEYHTKPAMQFPGDSGYHRGPIHVGVMSVTWRSYGWTEEQVRNYIKMKTAEDLEIMGSIDQSLKSAMDQLEGDIEKYLNEAEMAMKKPEKEKEGVKGIDIFEPFVAVGKGVKDAFSALIPTMPSFSSSKKDKKKEASDKAKSTAKRRCFTHYNVFKKAHGMLSW